MRAGASGEGVKTNEGAPHDRLALSAIDLSSEGEGRRGSAPPPPRERRATTRSAPDAGGDDD